MKVLIVEDDQLQADRMGKLTKLILGANCEIIGPVEDFKSALDAIELFKPDIALLDLALHQDLYGGLHVAEFMEKYHPVPIIFLSALTDPDVLVKTAYVDSCDFLKKPFDHKSLSRALDKALKSRENEIISVHRLSHAPNDNDRFWAKVERNEYVGVRLNEIIYFQAFDHFNKLYVKNAEHPLIVKGGLKKDVFDAHLFYYDNFYQLSRSYVINRDYINSVKGNELVIASGGFTQKIKIPRDKKEGLFDWLNIKPHTS